jgi:hypothetical protein
MGQLSMDVVQKIVIEFHKIRKPWQSFSVSSYKHQLKNSTNASR